MEKMNVNDAHIPEDLICPITLTLIKDPVVAADGHSYERKAITEWLTNHRISPSTGEDLQDFTLRDNLTLKKLIALVMESLSKKQHEDMEKVDLQLAIKLREDCLQDYLKENLETVGREIKREQDKNIKLEHELDDMKQQGQNHHNHLEAARRELEKEQEINIKLMKELDDMKRQKQNLTYHANLEPEGAQKKHFECIKFNSSEDSNQTLKKFEEFMREVRAKELYIQALRFLASQEEEQYKHLLKSNLSEVEQWNSDGNKGHPCNRGSLYIYHLTQAFLKTSSWSSEERLLTLKPSVKSEMLEETKEIKTKRAVISLLDQAIRIYPNYSKALYVKACVLRFIELIYRKCESMSKIEAEYRQGRLIIEAQKLEQRAKDIDYDVINLVKMDGACFNITLLKTDELREENSLIVTFVKNRNHYITL